VFGHRVLEQDSVDVVVLGEFSNGPDELRRRGRRGQVDPRLTFIRT
jgi:hypothetical protein